MRMQAKTFRGVILLGGLILVLGVSLALAGKVQLPEGQQIKIKFPTQNKISSGNVTEGTVLTMELAEPIQIGGVTIVEQGAVGNAKVTKVKKAGKGGSGGMIIVTLVDLQPKGEFQSPEGTPIPLRGTIEDKGGNKKILSYVLGFGLLIKGGQGEIVTDSVYTAEISKATILESK